MVCRSWQRLCGSGTKASRRLTARHPGDEYLLRLRTPFAKGTRLPGTTLSQARDSAVAPDDSIQDLQIAAGLFAGQLQPVPKSARRLGDRQRSQPFRLAAKSLVIRSRQMP